MQVFLPYPDFRRSLDSLDMRRLGKQRVEAFQLIRAHQDASYGWQNHPAKKMFDGYVPALVEYYNLSIEIWVARGYKNTMERIVNAEVVEMPNWFGQETFHSSHRSNLLRKMPEHYGQFGWTEPNDLPYVWPASDRSLLR